MRTPIYPPRPKGKIIPGHLDKYESTGKYLAQRKFNGSRNLIYRSHKGEIYFYSRYGRSHLKYKVPLFLKNEINSLNFEKGKEYWLDSELMHPRIDHVVILYDVLHAGKYLYGETQTNRLQLLSDICNNPLKKNFLALEVTPHVWLAEVWDANFLDRFKESLGTNLAEGLILRSKNSMLDSFGHKPYECEWQLRVRKPAKNYQF